MIFFPLIFSLGCQKWQNFFSEWQQHWCKGKTTTTTKPLVSLSQSTSCLTTPSSPALHLLQPHPAQLMDVFAAATPRPQPEEGKIHFSAVFSFFCVCVIFQFPKHILSYMRVLLAIAVIHISTLPFSCSRCECSVILTQRDLRQIPQVGGGLRCDNLLRSSWRQPGPTRIA